MMGQVIMVKDGSLTRDRITELRGHGYEVLIYQGERPHLEPELTLRDQFAMAALTGLLSARADLSSEAIVSYAYGYADMMLKQRTEPPKQG